MAPPAGREEVESEREQRNGVELQDGKSCAGRPDWDWLVTRLAAEGPVVPPPRHVQTDREKMGGRLLA